jgi:putative nucleotidyltransferase with HDIG domain
MWTILTYSFFTYQLHNESIHILDNKISRAQSLSEQAEKLIAWSFEQRAKLSREKTMGFSMRDLIDVLEEKQGSTIEIESNYSEFFDDITAIPIQNTLKKAQITKKNAYTTYEKGKKSFLFYAKPLLAQNSCLKCHAHHDKKVDDVLGNVNITVKIPTFYTFNKYNFLFLVFTYLSTWIFGLLLIWWMRHKSKDFFNEKVKNFEESIYSFVDMMERRDSYTAGHSKRVAKYASLIAQKMNFSQEDVTLIYRAGMLHDIGKIEIPDALLLKPDTLTSGEYELIKRHSTASYELLCREPFFELAKIVRHHHERYDGNGYPDGLKGSDIPILSQIISVADTFDAITTNRAYKKASSKVKAIEILISERGAQLNPSIVDIAKEIFITLEIETDGLQTSNHMLEDMRFSYYFRDQLTGYYNINYLKFILAHRENYTEICVYHVNCINFSAYNKKFGWKQGDKFLQTIADAMASFYPNGAIIRIFSDKFLVLHLDEHVEFDRSILDVFLEGKNVTVDFRHVSIKEQDINTVDKLEDIISGLAGANS